MYTTQQQSVFQPFVFSAPQQPNTFAAQSSQQQPLFFQFPQAAPQQQQQFFVPNVQQPAQQQQGKIPEATVLITKNKGPSVRPTFLLLGCHLDAKKQQLDQMNISHVVNCATELSHFQDGANSFTGRSVKYHIVSWSDMYQFNKFCLQTYFEQFKNDALSSHDFMTKAFNDMAGSNVLIHCAAGINRSATMAISFIMRMQSKNLYDTFHIVKSKRNIILPSSYHLLQLLKLQSYMFYSGVDPQYANSVFTVALQGQSDQEVMQQVIKNFVASVKLALTNDATHPMQRIQQVALKYWMPSVQNDYQRGIKRVLIPTVQQIDSMLNELVEK